MASQMVAPTTSPVAGPMASTVAPINIHPPPSSSSSPSGIKGKPIQSESLGDSGYESSWPSLSEAAAWSPPMGQKRRTSLKSGTAGTGVTGPGAGTDLGLGSGANQSTQGASSGRPPLFAYDDGSSFSSYEKEAPLLLAPHHHLHHRYGKSHHTDIQQSNNKQGQLTQQRTRQGKGQRRRARTQAYQARRMAQIQNMVPLVDLGSPVMEDDDHYQDHLPNRPIPLRYAWFATDWYSMKENAPIDYQYRLPFYCWREQCHSPSVALRRGIHAIFVG